MNSARYFKLGLFVLIGIGMMVAAVIALGAERLLEKHIPVQTVLDESISGLDVGAPVEYRGVKIGRVTSIAFAANTDGGVSAQSHRIARYVLIDMSLDANQFKGMTLKDIHDMFAQMTKNGLRARVDQQGLTGGVFVGLDYVDPKTPQLDVNWKSPTLYIPSAPNTMTQVMSAAEQLAGDLRKANLPGVVQHIDHLVNSAGGAIDNVSKVIDANSAPLNKTMNDLPAIASQLKATSARLDQLLNDKRLDRTLSNVADDSAGAGQTITDLRGTAQDLRTLISSQQQDIQAIIADLRRTAENLAALSSDARENPSRLILGGPPPRKEPGQ